MEDIQDLELCVELIPEELEELKGGDAVLNSLRVFPRGIPTVLLERIQGPQPDPWISSQQISTA